MKFPVRFMSIENELKNILPYLKGNVLNAGCGERDISQLLKKIASSVDNCDIKTSLPNSFLCEITSIPKPDATYNSILCNAVLEHVPYPEKAMQEFWRLLIDGGYLVISVPFLQPFHPTPFDYRRYTKTGIEQLATETGFKLLHIFPVHSLAQTIGWILWAYLEEHNLKICKIIMWFPIFFFTSLFKKEKVGKIYSANGFQAVMIKQIEK